MDKQKRIRKIFEILKAYPDGISGEYISSQIGVSSRTVRSDIKVLQAMIDKYEMTIESAPRKGYFLKCSESDLADKFIRDTFVEENNSMEVKVDPVEYIICCLLLNNYLDKAITQTQLADEIYVSISTLKSYFNECKGIFDKYNIKIINYKKMD